MKTVNSLIILMATILQLFSCTERIDLPLDGNDMKLVVEGTITTNTATVLLTQTTGYSYNQPPPPVTGAHVVIDDGETLIEFAEPFPGVYQPAHNFYGIEGKTYTLKINLAAPINGIDKFTATSYMNYAVKLDSAAIDFLSHYRDSGLWQVKCWLQDTPLSDYYRIILRKNGEDITSGIGRWIITDDTFFNGQYLSGVTVAYLNPDEEYEKLVSGDILDVELYTISREYYNFITDAKSELFGSNPLFSGPGANIRGNISGGAVGFFAAYPISIATVTVP
ncbi:MAG: DUF4249 domain-containing protein [Bacteroidales bacterium]|jgi:hypothetical protein|nr:DUF4249 domain-containing protein [Bacteroidales bacterium]